MSLTLLIIIYFAFISIGLPGSLLGAAWPAMYQQLEVPASWAGFLGLIMSCGILFSCWCCKRIVCRIGIGKLTVLSVGTTALALMGFSMSRRFWHLCLWAILFGLGTGSVDVVLKNYAAAHYRSRHRNWLYFFWGVGAVTGPWIMGKCLTAGLQWHAGYQITGILQIILTTGLFFTLSLWRGERRSILQMERGEKLPLKRALRISGMRASLAVFFCSSAVENSLGLWGGTYLVLCRGLSVKHAAAWTALFYLGLTLGRLLNGFCAGKPGSAWQVRIGALVAATGLVCLLLPGNIYLALTGLLLAGIGCAPICSSLLFEVPEHFGKEYAQSIKGLLQGAGYMGTLLMPSLFALAVQAGWMKWFPLYLLLFVMALAIAAEAAHCRHSGGTLK